MGVNSLNYECVANAKATALQEIDKENIFATAEEQICLPKLEQKCPLIGRHFNL